MNKVDKIFLAVIVGIFGIFVAMAAWPQPKPFTIAPQVTRVRKAVVHVYKHGVCQGSGCILTPDGIMFTAKHVTDGKYGDYTVTLDDGREFGVKYVIEDKDNDVSFFQLDLKGAEPNLPYTRMAEEDLLRVGDFVFIMGSPLGWDNFNSVSLGILSATNRDLYNREGWEEYQKYSWHVMLQTTSPAYPGNSGGPVFNLKGEVVGVLVAGQDATLNFSVPIARFRDSIETIRDWFRLCRFNVVEKEEEEPVYDEWYEYPDFKWVEPVWSY